MSSKTSRKEIRNAAPQGRIDRRSTKTPKVKPHLVIQVPAKNFSRDDEKPLAPATTIVVDSVQAITETESPVTQDTAAPIESPDTKGLVTMQLQLKGTSKNGKQAYYTGARQVIPFKVSNFEGGVAPATLDLSGPIVGPKVKMTPEERKAARAAKPKLTLAEQAAKARARADRLAAKVAAEAAKTA